MFYMHIEILNKIIPPKISFVTWILWNKWILTDEIIRKKKDIISTDEIIMKKEEEEEEKDWFGNNLVSANAVFQEETLEHIFSNGKIALEVWDF